MNAGKIALVFPVRLKLILMGIGLLILFSIILTTPEGVRKIFIPANTLPLVFSFLSILASGYHERWIFDKTEDLLIYQYGAILLHANRIYRISEFKQVELSQFTKGKIAGTLNTRRSPFSRNIIILSISSKSGKIHRLETYSSFHLQKIETIAKTIADYCALPLINKA